MLEMLGEPRSLPRSSSERVMVGEDLGNSSLDGEKLQHKHDVGEGTSSKEREDIAKAQLRPREESTWEGFRGKYSKLVPHLLELVTYQSGVEAVEVSCFFVATSGNQETARPSTLLGVALVQRSLASGA